jgi:1,4-dihydroxy-6-naphthoate synthase
MHTLDFAHSPCPNDMFAYTAWEQKQIPSPFVLNTTIAGIARLNQLALERKIALCKVSAAIVGQLCEDYWVLPVGAGIGYGVGPKLVAKEPYSLEQIKNIAVASPGINTMAHRLLLEFVAPREIILLPFQEIMPAICAGSIAAGLVINESRFSLNHYGLHEIADFGQLWQEKFSLPLPLGALVAKRNLGKEILDAICTSVAASLAYARENFSQVLPLIAAHSSEKDEEAIRQHIELYVNSDTYALSAEAKKAIQMLIPDCSNIFY